MGLLFVFREIDVPDPLRVTLSEDDAPYGKAEEQAAFTTGGALLHKRRKLPGRRGALFHVQAVDDEPLEINGAFRDFRMGRGHADDMRKRIERIKERANLLRVSWDGMSWTALLTSAKFGQEDRGHVTYELKFDIAQPDTAPTATVERRRADADMIDRILADFRARRAVTVAARGGFLATLNALLNRVDAAFDAFGGALRRAEQIGNLASRQVRRVTSLGLQVQQQCQQVRALLRRTAEQAAVIGGQLEDTIAWDNYTQGLHGALGSVTSATRDAVEQQRKAAQRGTRLVRVRPNDTLESIAQRLLNDPGRASELGLAPAQLVPGAIVRVPDLNGAT